MADILIRGMDKPFHCFACNLSYLRGERLFCPVTKDEVLRFKIASDCPIQELPEHGDLIDRDALKHKFCTHCDGYEHDTGACVDGDQDCMDAKIIMTASVIVPSNKEEANDKN